MLVLFKDRGMVYSSNLNQITTVVVTGDRITNFDSNAVLGKFDSAEEAQAKFLDIVDAYADGQKVYDVGKDVGYWKPKKKPAGRKPAAEKSAPAHNEPAPKK